MTADNLINKTIQDEYLQDFKLTDKIAEGGQGAVFRTDNKDYVIKIALDQNRKVISKKDNTETYEKYINEYKRVYLNPFPKKIHLVYPVSILNDYAGYVMKMVTGMIPFKSLIDMKTYDNTGGIRRRFDLLSKTASILSDLHGNGLVYCDISDGNIFITENVNGKNQNVWFIDADNVFICNTIDGSKGKLVYTSRFAAPEIINRISCCTPYSDSYAFAVLAFESLAQNHPFEGDLLNRNNQETSVGWSQSIKTSATPITAYDNLYSGKLPWIEDTEDDRNHTTNGIPRSFFLNDELRTLFNKTFGEGRNNIEKRPSIFFWPKAFARARDTTICCSNPECKMTYIYNADSNACPFCDSKNPDMLIIRDGETIVFAHEILWDKDNSQSEEILIPESVFIPFNNNTQSIPILSVVLSKIDSTKLINLKRTESLSAEKKPLYYSIDQSDSKNFEDKVINECIKYQSDDNLVTIKADYKIFKINIKKIQKTKQKEDGAQNG